MKNRLTYRLLLFCLLAVIFPVASRAHEPHSPNQTIKLGVIVPLTGPLAFFGQDFVRAYDLTAEENPNLKQTVQIIWEDSAYDAKQAIAAFNKLTSVDHVDVVYSFGGPMLNVLAPLAEAKKIPFFATESAKSDCQGRAYCSLFRNEEDEWGRATWQVLHKYNKHKIGIVKNQNQFMNTFVDAILRTKGNNDSTEILLDVPPETVDLRSNMPALKSKVVDALGVYLLPGSHHGLLNALRDSNTQFFMFGVEEFLERENNKGFEKFTNGALVIAPGATSEYKAKFESRYGESAGFYYTPAFYDFLMLLRDTVSKNPASRGMDLVNALHFSGKRHGVSGEFSVKQSKDGVYSYSFPIVVYRLNGNNVTVDQVISF